jgi:hypothetical protein
MSYTIVNLGANPLALNSIKRTLAPAGQSGASVVIAALTSEITAAGRNGYVSVTPSETPVKLTAESEGQTEFVLPYIWPETAAVLVILAGMILKETTDYVIDASEGTLTYQHDDLEIGDELILDGAYQSGRDIRPGSMPVDRLDADAQAMLVKVSWGTPVVLDGDNQKARIQLTDADGTVLNSQAVFRLTTEPDASLSIASGGAGSILAGTGNDVIVKASATGKVDVQVTCTGVKTITVAAGATQGSPILDCSATCDFAFTT